MTEEEIAKIIEQARVENWIALHLSNQHLTEFSKKICKLTNLQTLILSNNKVLEIPQEIGNLVNLEELSLSNNQITKIPKTIGNLTNLTGLDFSNNQITEIPQTIENLTNLTGLDFSNNQISKIPKAIQNLTNLKRLAINNNQIAEIPEVLWNLTNLEELSLSNNQITKIPKTIENLTNLTGLAINNNQIAEIPEAIKNLTNLEIILIDEKQLQNVAEFIIELKNIIIAVWNGNSYDFIPREIIQTFKTGQDLINYYFKERKIKLNEVKIMLIGQGNVGKTSVRQRLMQAADYQSKGRTEGVEIHRHIFNVNGEKIQANIWDFGGQEIYHTTHQFFFRSRCLYILVLDARAEDRSSSQLHYWLRQTQALGRNAPVIVVINKSEKQDKTKDKKKELDERYAPIKDIVLELKDGKFQNIVGCLSFSAEAELGIEELYNLIEETIANELPAVGTMITKTEAKVKDFLENQTKDYVSDEEFKGICRDIDEKERKDLITILDALGIITSFDDEHLSKTVVLKPEWITRGIYKILSSYILSQHNGKVERKDILGIFDGNAEDKAKYPPDKIDYILAIMEKHDLCLSESVGGGKKQLLFPVSFPVKEPNRSPFAKNTTHFEYRYKNIFFDSIIVRFLCTAYRQFGGDEKGNYWRKGVEFYWNDKKNRALVKADDVENKIIIKIDGETSSREILLTEITRIFDKIHDSFGDLKPEKKIIAPKRFGNFEFEYETLKNRRETGHNSIPAINEKGEELKLSIDYLLEGKGNLLKNTKKEIEKNLESIAVNLTKIIKVFLIVILIAIVIYLGQWVKEYWDYIEPYKEVIGIVTGLLLLLISIIYGKTLWHLLDEKLLSFSRKIVEKSANQTTESDVKP